MTICPICDIRPAAGEFCAVCQPHVDAIAADAATLRAQLVAIASSAPCVASDAPTVPGDASGTFRPSAYDIDVADLAWPKEEA